MSDPIANLIGQIPLNAATSYANATPTAPITNSLTLSQSQLVLLPNILNPIPPGKLTTHDLFAQTLNAIEDVFHQLKTNDFLQSILDQKIRQGRSGIFALFDRMAQTQQAEQVSITMDKEIIDAKTTTLINIETQINSLKPGYLNLIDSLNTKITTYNTAIQNVKNMLAALNGSPGSITNYQNAVNALNAAANDYNNTANLIQNATSSVDPNFSVKNFQSLLNEYNNAVLDLQQAIKNKNDQITAWNTRFVKPDGVPAQLQPPLTEPMAPFSPFPLASPITLVPTSLPPPSSFPRPIFTNLLPISDTVVAAGGSANLQNQILAYNQLLVSYNNQLNVLNGYKANYLSALTNLQTAALGFSLSNPGPYNTAVANINAAANAYNTALNGLFNTMNQMRNQGMILNDTINTEAKTLAMSPLNPASVSFNETATPVDEKFLLYQAGTILNNSVPTPKNLTLPDPIPSLISATEVQGFVFPDPLAAPPLVSLNTILLGFLLQIEEILIAILGSGSDLNDLLSLFAKNRVDQSLFFILSALNIQSVGEQEEIKLERDFTANLQGTNVGFSVSNLSMAQTNIALNNILNNQMYETLIEKILLDHPDLKGLLPKGDQVIGPLSEQLMSLIKTTVNQSLIMSLKLLENVLHKEGIDLLSGMAQGGIILKQILGILAVNGVEQLLKLFGISEAQFGELLGILSKTVAFGLMQLGAVLFGESVGDRLLLLEQQMLQQALIQRDSNLVESDLKSAFSQSTDAQKQVLSDALQKALILQGVNAAAAQNAVQQIQESQQTLDAILQQNGLESFLQTIDQTQQIVRFEMSRQEILDAQINKPSANKAANPIAISALNLPVSNATALQIKDAIQSSLIAAGTTQEEATKKAMELSKLIQGLASEDSGAIKLIQLQQLMSANLPSEASKQLLPLIITKLLTGAQTEKLISLIGGKVALDRVSELIKQQNEVIDHLNETTRLMLEKLRISAHEDSLRHIIDSNLLKYDDLVHINTFVNKILDPGNRLTFFGLMYESATNEFKRGYIDIRA